jgi:TolB protein
VPWQGLLQKGCRVFFFILLLLTGRDPVPVSAGKVAFMRAGKVCIMEADGTNVRSLTEDLQYHRPLAWSPDGKRLLFWKHSQVGWDIWVTDTDGKNQRNLTETRSGGCRSPSWSPDGKSIAFMRDVPPGLYVMDADGKNQRRLSEKGHRDEIPAWSPDGKRIAFTDLRDAGKSKVSLAIHVVDLSGRNEARLVEAGSNPAWSPDGKKILFLGRRRGNSNLRLVDPDGKNEVNLTNSPEDEAAPVWSKDGSQIAYLASKDGKTQLRLLDIDSKKTRQLAGIEGQGAETVSWSPDGNQLLFVSGAPGKEVVYSVEIKGLQLRKLTERGDYPAYQPAR